MNKKELFNLIAQKYDNINQAISLFTHKRFKKESLSKLSIEPRTIVDLCCGTGDIVGILKTMFPDAKIVGVDFSKNMLDIAVERYPDIEFLQQDVAKLPFEDESVDMCTISFGLRNVENMEEVLQECSRILKPDGIFFNLDLGKPNKFWNLFLKPYMYFVVPLLGKLACGHIAPLKYFVHSNENFPHPNELKVIYEKFCLQQISRKDFLFGQISSQICKKFK